MDLTIIIVNYNTKKLLKNCIDSIIRHTNNINYEIIVIDNNSQDSSKDYLKYLKTKDKKIKVIQNDENFGFAKAINQGLKESRGKNILLLNSDTIINNNEIKEISEWLRNNEEIGIVSCLLKNEDGSIQATGGYFPSLIRVFSWMIIQDFPFVDRIIKPFHPVHKSSIFKSDRFYKESRELDWITGAFFMLKREVFKDVGFFDEGYFMYTEDTDYCYRAKKYGWKIYFTPKWSITHIGGGSGKKWSHVLPEFTGIKIFYKKHYPKWQYPFLRLLLKIGALGRTLLLSSIYGKGAGKIYAQAFFKA